MIDPKFRTVVSKGSSNVLSRQIGLNLVNMVYISTTARVTYFADVYLSTPPLLASPPAYSGPLVVFGWDESLRDFLKSIITALEESNLTVRLCDRCRRPWWC